MTNTRNLAVPANEVGTVPQWPSLIALLERAREFFPEREFLRFENETLTFGETDRLTSQLAHRLVDLGIEPGDRVAIMLPNVVGWPISWLAAHKAGGVVVPINSAYLRADLEFVLRDSGAKIIMTAATYFKLVSEVTSTIDSVTNVLDFDEVRPELTQYDSERPAITITADTLANLQYTSGTTGFPKACMLTHDYWVRLGRIAAGLAEVGSDDVILTAQPFSYIDPQWNTSMALTAGVPLVVLPRFSASGFWNSVREHRATIFYILGTMPMLLLKQPPAEQDRDNAVRLVMCSGIPAAQHHELETRWGAPWREAYGMTESGADLISLRADTTTVGTGSMGFAVPGKEARVVDEADQPVPDGEVGELVVKGKPVMLGYWNQPEVTARTIVDGWLHTGDLARRDAEGRFYLVGRLKDMVRRGGENIASAEVESVIDLHPSVLGAAVIAVPDELFGEEVKVFVRLKEGAEATESTAHSIIEYARENLAKFKVPRFVEFVEKFPMTPSERVAKPTLIKQAAAKPGPHFDFAEQR